MSQEEEYEEDFAAKYDGVFAGEADGDDDESEGDEEDYGCLLYTSPSPRDS